MTYPENFEQKIGFADIREMLLSHCLSPLGMERVAEMAMSADAREIRRLHGQVAEMRRILTELPQQPEQDFHDLRQCVGRIAVEGTHLDEKELAQFALVLRTLHSWVELVRTANEEGAGAYPALEELSAGVFTFYAVTRRADQILDRYGNIKDSASPELAAVRSELSQSTGLVSKTLRRILGAAQSEGLVERDVTPTMRDGRLVIPVPTVMRRRLRGIVHDESATGKTVFIEPQEVVEANNRIRELEARERREILRILTDFTAMLRPNVPELQRAFAFLADIEFIRAKAILAGRLKAISPEISDDCVLDWEKARHPLLEIALARQGRSVVPQDFRLDNQQRILVISGPNAGGKSVCLKTVGLLQYMLQCGIPVPLGEASRCGVFTNIFLDMGDEQSIENDLSTYSSHLLGMKHMMRHAGLGTLLLIDEFGGGTEPAIGGAIAEAVLRRFVRSKALGIITTHYQNLKRMAEDTPGMTGGAMLYDRQRMEPLFQLQMGHPGSSFAVEIARKTGIPEDVIAEATEIVGQEYVDADKYLLDITRDKRYWEGKRQEIHSREKQMRETIERYEKEIAALQERRQEIIREAREQAERIIQESNARVENTIREIREAQAEKDRTRAARRELDDFRQRIDEESALQRDGMIERKMRQIEERRRRQRDRKAEKAAKAKDTLRQDTAAPKAEAPVVKGDHVRLRGQTTVGLVESVSGGKAVVVMGSMRTVCDVKRLEHAIPPKEGAADGGRGNVAMVGRQTTDSVRERHLQFHQDIDVRGMRGDEALTAVTYFIDDAVLVGAGRVRILHGTGTGILRQLIRQWLATAPGVKSAHDEHVQFGGAGITVVELE